MKTIGLKKHMLYALTAVAVTAGLTSCDNDDSGDMNPIVKEWDLELSPKLEIPAGNSTETATAHLVLRQNNLLEYEIMVSGMEADDELTAAHIHAGDPVSNGAPFIVLSHDSATVSKHKITGKLTLTANQKSKLMGVNVYINAHSTDEPGGLVRAQIDKTVILADDTFLSSDNEINPPLANDGEGYIYLRLTEDNFLYHKVDTNVVRTIDTDDFTAGEIYQGTTGTEGEFLFDLGFDEAEIGKTGETKLNSGEANILKTEDAYVTLRSTLAPDGLMRGQIDRD